MVSAHRYEDGLKLSVWAEVAKNTELEPSIKLRTTIYSATIRSMCGVGIA